MLHPRRRFKTPNLLYRYLSRLMLEMSLHCFLFFFISQTQLDQLDGQDADHYFAALLETLQFTHPSDVDIAKHWCGLMQKQLARLCQSQRRPKDAKAQEESQLLHDEDADGVRARLLRKYGQRAPLAHRLT